jgi:chorismate mutase/prephenate dehydratase
LSSIVRVYSHPQALGQCAAWLQRNLPFVSLVHTGSTAAAVIEALGDASGAAIAGSLAGERYGLPALVEHITDEPDNATRFVVIAARDAARTGHDKTTLAFRLGDEPGALRRALEAFEREGINLSRIESQPSRERAWDYLFSCDVHGHRDDPPVQAAIARLREAGAWVKLLGSYPAS